MKKTIVLSAIMGLFMTTTVLAAGWEQREDGAWIWRNNSGEMVRETWKSASDGIDYFLGSDGVMVTNRLVEFESNYYYVDALGRKASEQWVSLYDEESEANRWYYFMKSGKMYRPDEAGTKKEISGERYIFDTEGRLLYGWITEDGYMIDLNEEPDGWKRAAYYAGDASEGNLKVGWRQMTVNYYNGKAKTEEDEDDPEEKYRNNFKTVWFYFNSAGKKMVSNDDFRQTNAEGKEYRYKFDENGVMTSQKLLNPVKTTTTTKKTTTTTKKKDVDYSKWTEKVPTASENAYYNEYEIKQKFYTRKDGTKAKNVIEKIDSKYYCFDSAGIMKVGLLAIKDGKYGYTLQTSLPWDEQWASDSDLREAMNNGYKIMYFDEETGAREKGKMKLEMLHGERTLCFDNDGCAVDGAYNGYLYSAGILQTAEYDTQSFTVNGKTYVVNEKGRIVSGE